MHFKSFGIGTVLASALVASTLTTTPAQAASIGVAGTWQESISGASPASLNLSFSNLNTLFADGVFTGYTASSIGTLPLSSLTGGNPGLYGINTSGGFDGKGWKTYSNGTDTISFDLDLDATWLRTYDSNDGDTNYEQFPNALGVFEYTGVYNLPGGGTLRGTGNLNASQNGAARLFETTQTAVPTPALLPGLIGMGIAAWRKRKGELIEEIGAKV